jgi:hypothetical protein
MRQAILVLAAASEATITVKYVFCGLCGHYRPIRKNGMTLLSPTWKTADARFRACCADCGATSSSSQAEKTLA